VSQDQRIHILSTKKERNHSLDRLDKRRAIGRLIVQWIICTVMLLVATYAFLYAALLAERMVQISRARDGDLREIDRVSVEPPNPLMFCRRVGPLASQAQTLTKIGHSIALQGIDKA
jgi:hypothetical protein